MTDDDLLKILRAIAAQHDAGSPASLEYLTSAVDLPSDLLDQRLKEAQDAALVARVGKPIDHTGSPIERAPEGWILLAAGFTALGRDSPGPLDPSPLD